MIYIFWTAPDENEAERIIKGLIQKKWVACANIFPAIRSFFWWNGEVQDVVEVKVVLKTQTIFFDPIASYIQEEGSYDVPEVSMVLIDQVHPQYLKWLESIVNNSDE